MIHAYVEETPEVYLEYGGKQLGVVKNTADVAAPADSFEKTTITVEGKEIDAWTSTLMNRTVIYLIDEESGARSFYLYDEESGKDLDIPPDGAAGQCLVHRGCPRKPAGKRGHDIYDGERG